MNTGLEIDAVDAVVVGAGVVGLATARALALRGLEVLVLERHRRAGEEISSRNSGVIHAGIYYPPGSLKARLCVTGRDMLYRYCEERGIAHRRCGKLIVAQDPQLDGLRELQRRAAANGVSDLSWLTPTEVRELEPLVCCSAALFSPSTGIIDVHELMTTLTADLESQGGVIAFDSELLSAHAGSGGFQLQVRSGGDVSGMQARALINCAGLAATALPGLIEGYPRERLRPAYYAKGNYFICQNARPFKRLVYPMPNEAGLGVHATIDLDGLTRFGPDVEWVTEPDYEVDERRADAFYDAIREYWPGLPVGSLRPGYAGVRPKISAPGSAAADFLIEHRQDHGVAGLVNLLGIESPGLTACLAIAEQVAECVLTER